MVSRISGLIMSCFTNWTLTDLLTFRDFIKGQTYSRHAHISQETLHIISEFSKKSARQCLFFWGRDCVCGAQHVGLTTVTCKSVRTNRTSKQQQIQDTICSSYKCTASLCVWVCVCRPVSENNMCINCVCVCVVVVCHLCPDVAYRAGCVDGQTVGRPSDRPVFLIDRGITETEESAVLS